VFVTAAPAARLRGTHWTEAIARSRQLIEAEIEVDLTRAKPICHSQMSEEVI
jgi:hypothetical protein